MELFKKISSDFEKTAVAKMLSDNTEVWPNEILAALYKQHQFLGSYEINLQIDGQEENLGFLYGSFQVKNAGTTVATQHQGMNQGMVTKDQPEEAATVRIPVIVTNGKLSSFDVFIRPDASFAPLDQARLEESLFEPSGYSAVSPQEAASSQMGQATDTMQPDVPSYGRGVGGVEKMGSVLEKASSTIPQKVREDFIKTAEVNPLIKRAIENSKAFATALYTIASTEYNEPIPEDEVDAAILQKVAGGYKLTHTTAAEFNPKTVELTNVEAQKFPKEAIDACLKYGTALFTYAPDSPEEVNHFGENLVDVEETGVYALMEKDGSSTRGAVLTEVVNLNGSTSGLSLTITPSGASFQEKVAGVRCGDIDLTQIQGSIPYGDGVFLFKEGSVTEPITISNTIVSGDNTTYLYENAFGQKGHLKIAEVNRLTSIEGGDYLLPADARFIPTIPSSGVMSDKTTIDKIANYSDLAKETIIVADGGLFSFRGACVDELNYEEKNFVKESSALLLAGLLGAPPDSARALLKTASSGEQAKFISRRVIVPASKVKVAQSSKEFEDFVFGLRANLIKEAAAIAPAAEETLDSVLSLNFITPENVQGFMEALPSYEQALSSLSELLVAVRIGIPDVPEAAVLSCIRSLSRTVDGLNKLGLRQEALG